MPSATVPRLSAAGTIGAARCSASACSRWRTWAPWWSVTGPARSVRRRTSPAGARATSRIRTGTYSSWSSCVPELPDITAYIEALEPRVLRQPIQAVRLASPFVLRTFDPPISATIGKQVIAIHRIGKRIAFEIEGDLFLVLHLMIAGRLRWGDRGAKVPGKLGLAAIDFPYGTLLFTEAATKKRASLHLVRGKDAARAMDRGGIEVLDAPLTAFREALLRENHTLKRALTDPRLFSGIGNAYSDEILHRARLSPLALTHRLNEEGILRLYGAIGATLLEWIDRLRKQADGHFPEKV